MSKPKERQLLFSVTIKDCEIQTFTAGGKGGQNQNSVNSGVRILHTDSGARGEARDSRNQLQNKRAAFLRMCESKTFKAWHKKETARRMGQKVYDKTPDQVADEVITKVEELLDNLGSPKHEANVEDFKIEVTHTERIK